MSNYLQDAATYSKDKWTSVVDYFYGPNIPPKPLGTRTKDNIIQFTKNHPYITAQLGLFAASVVVGKISKAIAKRVKQDTILELDLDNIDLTERPVTPNLFEALNTSVVKKTHYLDVVEAIQLAAKDPKVIGLFCRLGNPNHPGVEMSHVQEIRAAVETFRNAKKVTVAFTESLDHGQNIAYYYLASTFEHIYAQPSGLFFLPGLSAEQPFVKGLLEKLEMEFVGERREKHKNMWDLLTEKKFTPEHRENVDNILSALNEHIITKIAQGRLHAIRRLPNNQNVDLQGAIKIVNEWFDMAGITGKEAKSLGVIDEFGYKNEVRKSDTSKLCGVKEDKTTFLFLSKYLEKKGGNSLSKPKTNPAKELTSYKRQTVAVVYATGNIHRGEAPSGYDDPAKKSIYGDTVASALRNAAEDKSVKCIIFRVNSGGGDAIGSELVNHEIERIRNEKKIKVVVSVGSVAASGGYWISMNADSIVCNETSIMGSIGVVFGKFYTREFWENKLGITYDQIKKNKLADINSSLHKYDDEQQQVMKKLTDEIYDDFKQRVSNARNISREDVDQLAQGKVYMGVEAKRLKLVDELGGFDKAVEVAKQLLNVPPEQEVDLVEYPKTVPFFKKFLANKKPAENADEQDKKRAFAQSGSAVGFLYSMIMGGDCIFTRFTRVFLGNSGLSKLQDITNAGGVQAVDHTSISL